VLGRKTYTPDELDAARTATDRTLAAYRRLAEAIERSGDTEAKAALGALEPLLFNELTLALDRRFVHRLRSVTGKDGTPLNELELLAESLMNNDGELRGNNVIRLRPAETVLGLDVGDDIALGENDFVRLAHGVLGEIESKYVLQRSAA
jgi:hypothetical protein